MSSQTVAEGVYAAGWILGGLALALALLFARVSLAGAAPEAAPRQLDPKVTEEEACAAVAGRLTRQATAA